MRLSRVVALAAVVFVPFAVAVASNAQAQVCGDADGNGSVSVTDAVNALRAAALLSNVCDVECDVDGSGSITVTDGVNILRQAADLSSARFCPDVSTRVASMIGGTLGFFGPLTKIGALGATPADAASPCDNSDGGFQQTASGFTFDDCVFGEVSLTGGLGVGDVSRVFSNLQIARIGEVLTLQGTLNLETSGESPVVSGELDAASTILGSYVITFQQIAIDALGNMLDGLLVFDVSDADIDGVVEVRVTLTEAASLPVVLRFDDQTTGNFNYTITTDVLTPVTSPTPLPDTPTPVGRTPTPTTTATPNPCGNVTIIPPNEPSGTATTYLGTTGGGSGLNGTAKCNLGTGSEKVFSWIPPANGTAVFRTCPNNTNFANEIYIRTSSCSAGAQVACDRDNLCTFPPPVCDGCHVVELFVNKGTQYFIVVDGLNGTGGNVGLEVEYTPQVN